MSGSCLFLEAEVLVKPSKGWRGKNRHPNWQEENELSFQGKSDAETVTL